LSCIKFGHRFNTAKNRGNWFTLQHLDDVSADGRLPRRRTEPPQFTDPAGEQLKNYA
jgi:hypothetical protein